MQEMNGFYFISAKLLTTNQILVAFVTRLWALTGKKIKVANLEINEMKYNSILTNEKNVIQLLTNQSEYNIAYQCECMIKR